MRGIFPPQTPCSNPTQLNFPDCIGYTIQEELFSGGEGGVRTHGTIAGTRDFQSRRFGRSRTSP